MSALATSTSTSAAQALFGAVLDHGSFVSWDSRPVPVPAHLDSPGYRAERNAMAAVSGADEAVASGEGRIGGHRLAVVASDFGFLAGSFGVAAAERFLLAVERATAERLPLLAVAASGGTRMQEGTPAFLRMPAIAAAVTEHRMTGLPYLVYLRHPTTGGVLASWGSLGQLTLAEPGALIGFLGPRVFAALRGEPFPSGVQTAENLHAHGLVDAIVPVEELAPTVRRILDLLSGTASGEAQAEPTPPSGPEPDAWESILRSRRPDRPGVRDVLRLGCPGAVPLTSTEAGAPGTGTLLALAAFGGRPCVLVGQDRRHSPTPGALRTARRGMQLATELDLPLVTLVDTHGAELSAAAEEGGLAGEIARCLADLTLLPVPTVSVLLGPGAGGAALALFPADRVIAARHAWLAPLPPEGAAAILHGEPKGVAELARAQHVHSADLVRIGAVDTVLDELPDAADDPAAFIRRVGVAVAQHLADLGEISVPERLARRRSRYRSTCSSATVE